LTLNLTFVFESLALSHTIEQVHEKATSEFLPEIIRSYNFTDSSDRLTKVVDDMQSRFHCCGVNGSADWKTGIPFSCCSEYVPSSADSVPQPIRYCPNDSRQPAFSQGCLNKVVNAVNAHYWYLASTVVSFALIQIMAVVLACCVAYSVKKHYQVI
jgi:CD63 antigen